ncbi:unnamed protein product [Durusdinium trenchii]|uniref:Uncharacterized protein n=1 Tax=Durusdinium trenchii TaxID=1381693 RepID=A0ABP0NRM0_9DINO
MAPSADGRFTQLLKELEEVHEEEVSRLRAELREVEDKMMPSPRISPPVLANEGDADQQEVKEAKDQAAETLLIPVEVRHVDSSRSVESQERGSEEKDKLKLKPPTLNLYRKRMIWNTQPLPCPRASTTSLWGLTSRWWWPSCCL